MSNQSLLTRVTGKSAVAGVALAVAAGLASTAYAAPIPGIQDVQDLIDQNQGDPNDGIPQGGIVVDGLRYYDFTYTNSGNNPPAASEVEVQTAPSPTGFSGLEFSYDWTAAGAGNNMRSTIRYKLHSEVGAPVNTVGLFFDGDVPPGNEGIGTFASVTEVVRDLAGNDLGELSVFDDGTGPGVDNNSDFENIAPPRLDLDLTKAIRVRSEGPGVSTISVVDNVFRQVPEPTSLAVLALGGGFMALRRRRTA